MATRDHQRSDDGYAQQFRVVQLQCGVGMAREEPVVLDLVTWVAEDLGHIDPALLDCRGNKIERGEPETCGDADGCAQRRSPRARGERCDRCHRSEQIARHYSERCVREPGAGNRKSQWGG